MTLEQALRATSPGAELMALSLERSQSSYQAHTADDWKRQVTCIGQEEIGEAQCWVWDSSRLIPPDLEWAASSSSRDLEMADFVLHLFSIGLPNRPIAQGDLTKETKEKLSRLGAKIGMPTIGDPQGGSGLVFDAKPRLMIEGDNGQIFQITFGNLTSTPQLYRRNAERSSADRRRLPGGLAGGLRGRMVQLADGRHPLKQLLAKLSPSSGRLTLDPRIQHREILIVKQNPSKMVDLSDLAWLIASSMGLYWREAGDSWHLACSPETPMKLVKERNGQRVRSTILELYRHMGRLGLLPEGVAPEEAARSQEEGFKVDRRSLLEALRRAEKSLTISPPDSSGLGRLIESSKGLSVRWAIDGRFGWRNPNGASSSAFFYLP